MQRISRHLSLIVMLASLALAVAIVLQWVRSYQGPEFVKYTSAGQWYLGVTSGHGTVDVLYIGHWPQEPELRRGRYDRHVYYGTRYSKRVLGFGAGRRPNGGRFVNVPHWFLAACAAASAALAARAWRRGVRLAGPHACGVCGYDLRASPGRCPECGTERAGRAPPIPSDRK